MQIACFLFDGITALDIVGPYEVLQRLPDADVPLRRQAGGRGPHRQQVPRARRRPQRSTRSPSPTSSSSPAASPPVALEHDDETLDWIRAVDADDDVDDIGVHRLDAARRGRSARRQGSDDPLGVAAPAGRATARSRPGAASSSRASIITAAGVSSGIDMGLTLAATIAGDEFAQAIQLGIEYDPQPPFDAGSVEKAPDHIVELLADMYAASVDGAGESSIRVLRPRRSD